LRALTWKNDCVFHNKVNERNSFILINKKAPGRRFFK